MTRRRLIALAGGALCLIAVSVYMLRAQSSGEIFELSDAQVRMSFFTPDGADARAATLQCAVNDTGTGSLLWAPAPFSVNATSYKFVIPSTANSIVRQGFCGATTTQACAADGECPAGEPCLYVQKEAHLLTCHWTTTAGGNGTWETPFDVKSLRFYPFA